MTKPRYLNGCSAGSQEHRRASSSDNAIYVNLNNGNVNWNNRNNSGRVRAVRRVRASECRSAEGPSLQELMKASRAAEAGKKPSLDMVRFQATRGRRLLGLQREIIDKTWRPRPVKVFVSEHPKTREIHVPAYEDRVVHHLIVPTIVSEWEPKFIHDAYANRVGKGSHKAVQRVGQFMREVSSGQGGGFSQKYDIKNFFPSIRRDVLWAELKRGMERADFPLWQQHIVHALLRKPPLYYGAQYLCTDAQRALVPPHKRLENARPGCGICTGNLSSQIFAGIYLNPLDQFIKHVLKVQRYVRYVDDFVLFSNSREQLEQWSVQIKRFLAERLHLELKPGSVVTPLSQGVDFLGYVVFPTHVRVRPRVVAHARSKLNAWERRHVAADALQVTPEDYEQINAIDASYQGHFRHANSHRLQRDFVRRFPWLQTTRVRRRFHRQLSGRRLQIPR
jgi:RNA-directed DNA polymerase